MIAAHAKLMHEPLRPQMLQRDVEAVTIIVENPPENLDQCDHHTQMAQETWEPWIHRLRQSPRTSSREKIKRTKWLGMACQIVVSVMQLPMTIVDSE